jgi:hypothetical protein
MPDDSAISREASWWDRGTGEVDDGLAEVIVLDVAFGEVVVGAGVVAWVTP